MIDEKSFIELFIQYSINYWPRILKLAWQHVWISAIALGITMAICIPLGVYLTRNEKISPYVIGAANVFQTIPSLALLGFLILVFGIGNDNAICALILYAMLPVIQNTYTGIKSVPAHLVSAARGMGMTELQILTKVELPLARPVIIAGIRVAAVWIIGTATLASCIGGGGLGKLIFSGLASIRYEIIMAGAVPVTILALFADQGFKMIQKYYDPKRKARRLKKRSEAMIKGRYISVAKVNPATKAIIIAVSVVFLFGAVGQATAAETDPMKYKGKVRIAAQTVNETIILAWMAKLLIDNYTGLETNINTDFAASSVLHQAMAGGEIDLYPTWTGTQLTGILRYEGPNLSKDETFKRVKEGFEKKFNMTWAKPFGFSNTYIMAVRKETADKYKLKKASDLKAEAKGWILGGDENFDTRTDAYPGWSKAYGINFKEVLPMQYSMMYQAIANKEVEVIAAYATDSRLVKLNLVTLEDDKEFFPDYSAAYVLDMKATQKYPELLNVVSKLSDKIDSTTMTSLNLQFDEGGDPKEIAEKFLKNNGYIK